MVQWKRRNYSSRMLNLKWSCFTKTSIKQLILSVDFKRGGKKQLVTLRLELHDSLSTPEYVFKRCLCFCGSKTIWYTVDYKMHVDYKLLVLVLRTSCAVNKKGVGLRQLFDSLLSLLQRNTVVKYLFCFLLISVPNKVDKYHRMLNLL